jgi:hypothetical protein
VKRHERNVVAAKRVAQQKSGGGSNESIGNNGVWQLGAKYQPAYMAAA